MGVGLCFFSFILGIFFFLAFVLTSNGSHLKLVRTGRPARGILLEVSPIATRLPSSSQASATSYPVERRQALVDVELPGQAPVEVRVPLLIPLNLSALVLPGATVELRVHPRHLKSIAVVGPGSGFTMNAVVPAPPGKPS